MYTVFLRSLEANKYRRNTEEVSEKYRRNELCLTPVLYGKNFTKAEKIKAGNYLLKIETNDDVVTKQFVKE
jgi:hypothetical protein